MKKIYRIFNPCLVFFLFLSSGTKAQLPGVVTIDNTTPATVSNYTSFTDFATALNSATLTSPLSVNVSGGPYIEQVNFTQVAGISATNSVTINGNNCTIAFSSTNSALPHTVLLTGADYMNFYNLNIIGAGTSSALAVHLWSGADNNLFSACTLSVPVQGTNSYQVPLSISGSSTNPQFSGAAGSNNTVSSCTLIGGYFNVCFYGVSTIPFNTNNKLLKSLLQDSYLYSFYNVYCTFTTLSGNIIERPNKTSTTTWAGVYLTAGSTDALVEKNHIRKSGPSLTTPYIGAFYGIYVGVSGSSGHEILIRNNIISDFTKITGSIYGIMASSISYAWIDHNTICFDDQTGTAGSTYGLYTYGANSKYRNNIAYISKTGTGTKQCLYTQIINTQTIESNVWAMFAVAGTTAYVYSSSAPATTFTTLASWRATSGFDLYSHRADPMFANPSSMDFTPTNTVVNNGGVPAGIAADFYNVARSPVMPDAGAIETYTTLCAGLPSTNSFTTPVAMICPNQTVSFNLAGIGSYTNSGYTITWQSGTGTLLGPFTSVAGASLNVFQTPPVPVNSFYRALITCTNGNLTYTTPAQGVTLTPSTSGTVPYSEDFDNGFALNKLPNCSWSASNVPPNTWTGGTTLTYNTSGSNYRAPRSGTGFASFYNNPGGTNYFYTNGIYLQAGITYSASLWFISETVGYNNWSDLSIHFSQNQNPTNMTMIAATNGTLTPNLYTELADTFNVSTTGMYYIVIRASAGAGSAPYLSWDDLSITIPCQYNSPDMLLTKGTATICTGQSTNITAYRADTYMWSTAQTTSVIIVNPTFPQTYTVTGTNTLSGCSTTLTQFIDVIQSSNIIIVASPASACEGQPVTLTAYGGFTYIWAHTGTSSVSVVYPTATTSYKVYSTDTVGCTGVAVIQVTFSPAPPVASNVSNIALCHGDAINLTATGALTYKWILNSGVFLVGNPVTTSPGASAQYTLVGADAKECEASVLINVGVIECTGLNKNITSQAVNVYPNPTSGAFVVELGVAAQQVEVTDITGRVIFIQMDMQGTTNFDISGLANGIYYVKVKGDRISEVVKIVKSKN